MSAEYDAGYEYGQEIGGGKVDAEEIVHGTVDMPEEDYLRLVESGVDNPDAREYWRGYNDAVSGRT